MDNLLIPTKIVRSKRKSISLIIERNGDFIVRAPIQASEQDIFAFINQKQNWIITRRADQLRNIEKPIMLKNDESITILGQIYIIKLTEKKSVKLDNNIIFIPAIDSQKKLVTYLKKLAKQTIENKIRALTNILDFSTITINSAKTRWGSCSSSNRLHFTYKLMLCPEEVVDYVIIHELSHIKVKNHSKKFWDLVASYYPNYKACEKWLKQNRAVIDKI